MSLLVIVGMLVIEVLLYWGYVNLVDRSGSVVVRGVLGATLVATLLAMGLWWIYDTALILADWSALSP
jgi:glucose uptake protein GlcU